jgi:hypothetical protein
MENKMKFFKSPQKVLILFLSVLIVISFFMIVRLEGKAASLQSQWEKHKKSLEKNKDVLDKLDIFSRFVKSNVLKMDDSNIMLISGKTFFNLRNDEVLIETNGDLSLGTLAKSLIGFDKSGNIYLGVNSNKKLGYDKSKDFIYMQHNGSRILLGQHNFKSSGTSQGISLRSKTGGPSLSVTDRGIMLDVPHSKGDYRIQMGPHKDNLTIRKDESVIKLEKDDISIQSKGDIRIGPSTDKYIGYKADEDRFYIHHSGSEIFLGEIKGPQGKPFANGIYIRSKVGGPYLTVNEKNIRLIAPMKNGLYDITIDPENKLLGLNCGNSYIVLDKDDIDIEAKGNISISSLNGIVSINGKKVSLNE